MGRIKGIQVELRGRLVLRKDDVFVVVGYIEPPPVCFAITEEDMAQIAGHPGHRPKDYSGPKYEAWLQAYNTWEQEVLASAAYRQRMKELLERQQHEPLSLRIGGFLFQDK